MGDTAATRAQLVLLAASLALPVATARADLRPPGAGQAREIFLPLVTFGDPGHTRGWTFDPWGNGTARLTIEQDTDARPCLTLKWQNSATLANRPLIRRLADEWKDKRCISAFYIRCKGDFEGSWLYLYYQTRHEGKTFSFNRQVLGSHDRHRRIRQIPLGGAPEPPGHGRDFNILELDTFGLSFRGKGSLQLSEIGIVVRYTILDTSAESNQEPVVGLPEATGPVVIDGSIDEPAWQAARTIDLHPAPPGDARGLCDQRLAPLEKTEVSLLWDDRGLYGAARCLKKDMGDLQGCHRHNHPDVHLDECIEIYIDPHRARLLSPEMRKFAVNANGAFGVLRFKADEDYEGFVAASRKLDDRWQTEFFVPWKVIGMTPRAAEFLGFNITRQTRGTAAQRSGWATTAWNGIADFRTLVLTPSAAAGQPFPARIELGIVSPGVYLLHCPTAHARELRYTMKLFAGGHLIASDAGLAGRAPLCVSMANPSLGAARRYTLCALVQEPGRSAAALVDADLMDGATGAAAPLSIDSVALFPTPRSFALEEAATPLGDATTIACTSPDLRYCVERIRSELAAFYGITLRAAPRADDATIVLGLVHDLEALLRHHGLTENAEALKHDGFLLHVGDKNHNRIIAAAREKRGVLYAAEALTALVKMSSPETGPPRIRHLGVVDWPRFAVRPWMVSLNGWWPQRRYDVALYTRMLATFPLALRYNLFTFMLDDYYLWPSVPEHANPFAWSPAQFARVVDFVNRNMCPVMPHVSSLTHMGEFLDRVGPLRKLVERGDGFYDHRLCTTHPDTHAALFALYDDMLRVCSRNEEYACPYFHIQCDELSFKGPPCPRCQGIPRTRLIGDHLRRVAAHLDARGKRPLMWCDMFLPDRPDSMSELLTDQGLPRQVVLSGWDPPRDHPAIEGFAEGGHDVWKVMTGYRGIGRLNDQHAAARGLLVANYHWWLSAARNLYTGGSYGPMAQALVANAAWNDFPDNDNSTWSEYCRVYGKWLMHNWSRRPLRGCGDGFIEVDISAIANEAVTDDAAGDGAGWFDDGPQLDLSHMDFASGGIDGIPVRFARRQNTPHCSVFAPGSPEARRVHIGKRLGSLIILHAADLPPERAIELQGLFKGDPEHGLTLIVYTVDYADGTSARFTASYGWNVLHWRNDPTSYGGKRLHHNYYVTLPGAFSRYLPDARSFWEGHTGEALKRRMPPDIAIYQYEWANPSPEKTIDSIEVRARGVPAISYALLAATGRTVRLPGDGNN